MSLHVRLSWLAFVHSFNQSINQCDISSQVETTFQIQDRVCLSVYLLICLLIRRQSCRLAGYTTAGVLFLDQWVLFGVNQCRLD